MWKKKSLTHWLYFTEPSLRSMALNDLPLQTLHLEQSLQTSLHNSDFDVSKVLIRDRLLVTGGCEHTCPFKRTHRILGFCRFLPLNIVPIVCPPLLLTRVLMGHMNSVTVHFHVSWSFIRSGISNLGLHTKVAQVWFVIRSDFCVHTVLSLNWTFVMFNCCSCITKLWETLVHLFIW